MTDGVVVAVAVMVAAAAGAACRFVIDYSISARASGVFPWGTLTVNVAGSFALGVVVGLVLRGGVAPLPRAALGAGFLGGFTTFSTFAFETLELLREGARRQAVANMAASIVLATIAAATGIAAGS